MRLLNCYQLVGQASLPANDVGQPFQAVSLTGWKAGPTAARATAQSVAAETRGTAPSPNPLPSVTLTSPLPQQSGRGTGMSGRGADPTPEDQLAQLESALLLAGLEPAEAIP